MFFKHIVAGTPTTCLFLACLLMMTSGALRAPLHTIGKKTKRTPTSSTNTTPSIPSLPTLGRVPVGPAPCH